MIWLPQINDVSWLIMSTGAFFILYVGFSFLHSVIYFNFYVDSENYKIPLFSMTLLC